MSHVDDLIDGALAGVSDTYKDLLLPETLQLGKVDWEVVNDMRTGDQVITTLRTARGRIEPLSDQDRFVNGALITEANYSIELERGTTVEDVELVWRDAEPTILFRVTTTKDPAKATSHDLSVIIWAKVEKVPEDEEGS